VELVIYDMNTKVAEQLVISWLCPNNLERDSNQWSGRVGSTFELLRKAYTLIVKHA
jgi:hypothetical protein